MGVVARGLFGLIRSHSREIDLESRMDFNHKASG
jgi:hypothetical protein